MTKDLFHFN